MGNTFFKFKQFTINQNLNSMKVGTDGVLLGAWADWKNNFSESLALDIGTGTGLISLMLAQRFNGKIIAIEINNDAANEAKNNFSESKWSSRIDCQNISLQKYTEQCSLKFDCIVSNPPFFKKSLLSEDKNKNIARHEIELNYIDLLNCAEKLITSTGSLSLIYPYSDSDVLIEYAKSISFFCTKRTDIKGRQDKEFVRSLLEFSKQNFPFQYNSFYIEEDRHIYSNEYIELTKNFYL